ncbi:MAG: trypsin-like peptidase domain-containing protein [Vampirovibrionales bacterium]|nr:trypsin-like peptidase domain-containing protein [Vampirovibrionales bacterium]
MKRWTARALACLLISQVIFWCPPLPARELSKAGQIFQQVKDGIVTVFSSSGHGSGVIIDASGLILTNSHVVKENAGNLRVKITPGVILEAKLLENDRANDLAILWVNLEKAGKATVLPIFTPPPGEDLVLVGEEIIAVGSPIQRETLEKTLTTGVVGKFEGEVIRHDASINGGNSGGPLLNYDGQIVGINTFVQAANGPPLAGAVPITKAILLLSKAKADILTSEKPSSELLPDTPAIPFPIAQLVKESPSLFTDRDQKDYNFKSNYFSVSVLTPIQGYHQIIKAEDKILKHRKGRARKKGFQLTDDEIDYKNLAFYNYQKPVVTVVVIPNPKLTTTSKVVNTLSFLAAAVASAASFGVGTPLMLAPFYMGKHEIKKDFLKMSLKKENNELACTPIETGRAPFKESMRQMTGYLYNEFIDKSYVGLYTFDSKCFETPSSLKLVIDIEGSKDEDRTLRFPRKIQELIVSDFKPYWSYVNSLHSTNKSELNRIPASETPPKSATETAPGAP